MRNVKIITDSCSDLGGDILEKYNLDYARMSTVLEEVETTALLTWSDEDAKAFYDTMRDGKRIITSQATAEEFKRIFTLYLEQGYDICYIGCSTKQSGSVNTGRVVAKKLMESYPDAAISCIDSLNASMGEGMLAVEAAKMAMAGKGIAEITETIEAMRNNVNQFVTVHSLEFLKRAGRVSASSAFFGNLMGVKPILISDADGVQTPCKKVKGRNTSLKEIVNLLKEGIADHEEQTIYMAHADCSQEEVDYLLSLIKENIPHKDIYVGKIGPIIGASIGPEAFAVFGFGKEVTYKVAEK